MVFKTLLKTIFYIYVGVNRILRPKQTAYYIVFESFIVGVFMTFILYSYPTELHYESILLFLSFFFIGTVWFMLLQKDKRMNEHFVMSISITDAIYLLTVPFLIILLLLYLGEGKALIGLIGILFYIGTLLFRSRRHHKKRDYPTPDDSELIDMWHLASAYTERAVYHSDNKNRFRTYYWTYKSTSQYKKLRDNEINEELKDAAKCMIKAVRLIRETIYSSSIKYKRNVSTAKQYFKKARELSQVKKCAVCGVETRDYDSFSPGVFTDVKIIYCKKCYAEYYYDKSESSNSTEEKSMNIDSISIKKAKSVLKIDTNNFKEEDVQNQYRELTKTVHPDAGGSMEEFIEVKESKKTLLSWIEKDT